MKLTKHANKRLQQRGIQDDVLVLISLFGEQVSSNKGCVKLKMTEKTRGKIVQILDRCRNKVIIMDKSFSNLITAYTLSR